MLEFLNIGLWPLVGCGALALYAITTYSFFTYCWEKIQEEAPAPIIEILSSPFGSLLLTILCLLWPIIWVYAVLERIIKGTPDDEDEEDE